MLNSCNNKNTLLYLCNKQHNYIIVLIPDFDINGLLPPGIHWATMDEIKNKLSFSQKRRYLIKGLERALVSFKKAGCKIMYLDGSFVTSKHEPGDIDACYEILGMDPAKLDPVLLDFKNERLAQKAKYGCEFFLSSWVAKNPPPITYLDFFQIHKETGNYKGIIGIKL